MYGVPLQLSGRTCHEYRCGHKSRQVPVEPYLLLDLDLVVRDLYMYHHDGGAWGSARVSPFRGCPDTGHKALMTGVTTTFHPVILG